MKKLFFFAVLILGITAASFAQETASATASATIVTPIAIAKTVDMSFGNVAVQSTTAGTVVMDPVGSRTPTSGCTLPAVTGTVTAASFNITGEGTYTYAITLPSSVTITHATESDIMTVDNFTSTPSGTGALTAGAQTLTVGATLNVSAAQLAGVYTSGTAFDVTVNYN